MKNRSSIILMSLATVTLLLSLIVPHHHHGQETCFVIEECNGHDEDPIGHDLEDDKFCSVKSNFLTSKSNDSVLVLLEYNQPVYLNFFVFYYHHIDLIDFLGSKKPYKPYVFPNKSILHSFFKGLRSPPSHLV